MAPFGELAGLRVVWLALPVLLAYVGGATLLCCMLVLVAVVLSELAPSRNEREAESPMGLRGGPESAALLLSWERNHHQVVEKVSQVVIQTGDAHASELIVRLDRLEATVESLAQRHTSIYQLLQQLTEQPSPPSWTECRPEVTQDTDFLSRRSLSEELPSPLQSQSISMQQENEDIIDSIQRTQRDISMVMSRTNSVATLVLELDQEEDDPLGENDPPEEEEVEQRRESRAATDVPSTSTDSLGRLTPFRPRTRSSTDSQAGSTSELDSVGRQTSFTARNHTFLARSRSQRSDGQFVADRSPARSGFLGASHRQPSNIRDVALDRETQQKLAEALQDPEAETFFRSQTIGKEVKPKLHFQDKIGLDSSCAIISRAQKLLFSLKIHLPDGGETAIQCFQDASEAEIIQTLFRRLQGRLDLVEGEVPSIAGPEDFVRISDMLLSDEFALMTALFAAVPRNQREELIHLFLRLTVTQKVTKQLLTVAVENEVANHRGGIHTLFRDSGFRTTLVAAYFRFHLRELFQHQLKSILKEGLEDPANPLDPLALSFKVFDLVKQVAEKFPKELRDTWAMLSDKAGAKFPEEQAKVLGSFLFLRLICPLLLEEELAPATNDPEATKACILQVSRNLQQIANQVGSNNSPAMLERQQSAARLFQDLTDPPVAIEPKTRVPSELSGLPIREAVNKLVAMILQNHRGVLRALFKQDKSGGDLPQQLIDILGYPLQERKAYQFQVTGSDYFVPSGDYRPLVENASLRCHFLESMFRNPSLSLVERGAVFKRKQEVMQVNCLLNSDALPSCRFESLDVHYFRERVLTPANQVEMPPFLFRADLRETQDALLPATFIVRVFFESNGLSKSIPASPNLSVNELMEKSLSKFKAFLKGENDPSKFALRFASTEEFLLEDVPLGLLAQVSTCLMRRLPVQFLLVVRKSIPALALREPTSILIPESVELSPQITLGELPALSPYAGDCPFVNLLEVTSTQQRLRLVVDGVSQLNAMGSRSQDASSTGLSAFGFVQVQLAFNGKSLAPIVRTSPCTLERLVWAESLELDIPIRSIPRESRLCFTLFSVHPKNETKNPLAWASFRLLDVNDCLPTESTTLGMWEGGEQANPFGPCTSCQSPEAAILQFTLQGLPTDMLLQLPQLAPRKSPLDLSDDVLKLSRTEEKQLERLFQKDALYKPTPAELAFLWNTREHYCTVALGLPKFLLSVQWGDWKQVEEAYRLLENWTALQPHDALELLGTQFEDQRVRQKAVSWIAKMSDDDLADVLLQLVQVLKIEKNHISALSLLLLRRGIQSPEVVGHRLFWLLSADMNDSKESERLKLIMEALLWAFGPQRNIFLQQKQTLGKMRLISALVSEERTVTAKSDKLASLLETTRFSPVWNCPYQPSIVAGQVAPSKCRIMDSALSPLRLEFHCVEELPTCPMVLTLFKAGDDLRQDTLTLQMIQIMDKLWKQNGLDMQMSPYGCLSTGTNEGLIEIVPDCVTTADIHRSAAGVRGAFLENSVANWLRKQNPSETDYKQAREVFTRSCAGYCVATYILGIGDRHNDNIMISRAGHLFHIDFGRFLGKWQTWKGLKRDRAPFVFTPEFAFVMGGRSSEDFERFCQLASQAFNVLRKNARIFFSLFSLMLAAGMPELKNADSFAHLNEAFALKKTEEEADLFFRSLISKSLNTTATRLNNALHILARSAEQ